MWIGFCDEAPVPLGAEVGEPCRRVGHTRNVIAAAGFDQQHRGIAVFRQTPRHD